MKRFHQFALASVAIIFLFGSTAGSQEMYRSAPAEKEVKSTMKVLEDYLNKIEDALIAEDLVKAASLGKELDNATHKLCNLDLSTSKLSSDEQDEFKRLRDDFHYRIDRLNASAKESVPEIAQYEFEMARQACSNCHKTFKRRKS